MVNEYTNLDNYNIIYAHLLGSPIGGAEGVDDAFHEKIKALKTMGNRLCHLRAHDAYCLL